MTRRLRARAVLVYLVASGAAVGAAAQGWAGPAGVGVEVRDEAGQPIAGAAVVLVPAAPNASGIAAGAPAPPFVFTDTSGRVEIRNLAEGEWQVEVRAAGYMIFNSYLKLASTAVPEVGFSSRQRTGTFWQPLQVRFFAPGSPGDAVMVAATKEERKGEKKRIAEQVELEKQLRKAQDRAETRDRRRTRATGGAEVAVLRQPTPSAPVEPPPAEPPPAVADAEPPSPPSSVAEVEPPPSEPTARAEPPARLPDAQPPAAEPPSRVAEAVPLAAPPPPGPAPNEGAVAPPVAAPAPPPPEAQLADVRPAPDPPRADAPAPARDAAASPPAAPPPAVPSIQVRPVLFTGGACPECKPGEWALIVERRAAPASGAPDEATCGAERDTLARRLANEVLAPAGAAAGVFAGPVADAWGNGLQASVRETLPGDLADALGSHGSSCQDLIGVLPQGARFIGFRFEAEDASGKGDCFGEEPCAIGQARFTTNPRIERTATVTVIHSSFRNESTATERRARMTLYFQPPRGWQPPR